MKCPTCADSTLVMSERQSVEIDYCLQCRGVWLDRGELDKLLERAATQEPVRNAPAPPMPGRRPDFADSDHGHSSRHGPRRKSWLSEIFD
jgi:Zn-finger nucleic acid-binding protein